VRARGRASPKSFRLLFDALEELTAAGALKSMIAAAPDLHVAFQLSRGEVLSCLRVRKGRIVRRPGPERAPTRVTLSPQVAVRALLRHPAGALAQAYHSGEAEVEGDLSSFLCVVALLEDLALHLDDKVP
jgi:hypothetical protein